MSRGAIRTACFRTDHQSNNFNPFISSGRTMKRTISKLLCLSVVFSAAFPLTGASVWGDDTPAATASKDGGAAKVEPTVSKQKSKKKEEQPARSVEMFKAMEDGLLTVDYIGKDATEASIIFKNKTGEPLDIVLPETFGAVPVLAQMGMGGMGGMGMGGMGGMG
ncbi:MAG: hypothetical protein MUD03_05035, partial [Pirellula sp.]|nr:hypothetical protein [Pirellula sp.]